MSLSSDEKNYIVNNLYGFYSNFIINKDYVYASHIHELSKSLQYLNGGGRLVVNMPPRHSKSSLITLAYPIFEFLHNKDLNIVIVTSTMTLAEKFGIAIKDWFNVYGKLFNCFKSDIKHSKTHLMFEDKNKQLYNGSIRLTSSGSTLTGLDVDLLILDDIYKGLTDTTPSLLEKKVDWFNTIITQRIEPHTKLIILHTRWSQSDLTGYLKENNPDEYQFIELPAVNEDGTVLWHERYDKTFFEDKEKEMGSRLFQALYQQKPLDETGTFFNTELLRYDKDYDIFSSVRSYDLAYSDESKGDVRDYTASCIMHKTIQGDYVISHVSMEQYGDRLFNVIKANARQDTPNIPILMETGTVGGASEFLFKEYKQKLQGFNVRQSKPIGAKVDRATPFKNSILDGKIIVNLNDTERELLFNQLNSFPLGKHDDLVDALSYAYSFLEQREYNSSIQIAPKPKRITI